MDQARDSTRLDFSATPLVELLHELVGVVRPLTAEQYNRHDPLMEGSVGGHVRHCLDHVSALLQAMDAALVVNAGAVGDGDDLELDYDARERGTSVERDPVAACAAMEAMAQRLGAADERCWERVVRVRLAMLATQRPAATGSTLGRELTFVLSHSVHHNAMIRAMVRGMGRPVPATFGYAPSTLAYLSSSAARADAECGERQGRCAR